MMHKGSFFSTSMYTQSNFKLLLMLHICMNRKFSPLFVCEQLPEIASTVFISLLDWKMHFENFRLLCWLSAALYIAALSHSYILTNKRECEWNKFIQKWWFRKRMKVWRISREKFHIWWAFLDEDFAKYAGYGLERLWHNLQHWFFS